MVTNGDRQYYRRCQIVGGFILLGGSLCWVIGGILTLLGIEPLVNMAARQLEPSTTG